MKINHALQLGLASGLLTVSAQAQGVTFSQRATIALTMSETAPALDEKDETGKKTGNSNPVYFNEYTTTKNRTTVDVEESGSKIVRSRMSNREILEMLVELDVISSIRGWSIIYLTPGIYETSSTPRAIGFYIVKAGANPINISEFLRMGQTGASVANEYSKSETTASAPRVLSSSTSFLYEASGKSIVNFSVSMPPRDLVTIQTRDTAMPILTTVSMQGVYDYSQNNVGTSNLIAPGSGFISSLNGSSNGKLGYAGSAVLDTIDVPDFEWINEDILMEGTMRLGKGLSFNFPSTPE
jgi:hypothetical protein